MAPKGKAAEKGGAAKGKGKGKTEEKAEGGKVKASQFVNVRHILVCSDLRQDRKYQSDGRIV